MKPPETLLTERFTIRKPRMDDAPEIFRAWASDPEVTRLLTWRPHESVEVTKSVLSGTLIAWEGDSRFPFVIADKVTGSLVGMIEIRMEGHRAELGYVMARTHWGKGYMTEAVKALIRWAFGQPQVYRVYATTSVDNIGSQRVMEKAGMQREGLLRRYIIHPNTSAEPQDSYMYAIVK